MKGFKDFLMRGNLVEIAVGLIMATSFGAVVDGWHSDSARTVILGSSDAGTADREEER